MSLSMGLGQAPKIKDVGIFWDYENVHIPAQCSSPLKACTEIVKVAQKFGRIQQRRVYSDYSRDDSNVAWWSADISESGFDLVSTPRRGATKSKETLDRKMIQDIIFFAWDVADRGGSPCVVLITSDGDFAYTINKLRDRGATNVVIHGSMASKLLASSADVALNLEEDVLPSGLLQQQQVPSNRLDDDDYCSDNPGDSKGLGLCVQVAPPLRTVEESAVTAQISKPSTLSHTGEQTRKDALDLLTALSSLSLGWILGSQLGSPFRELITKRELTSADPKTRFRLASAKAVEEGWILQGRQRVLPNGAMGEIVDTSTHIVPPTALSKHTFVKLGDSGKQLMNLSSSSQPPTEVHAAIAAGTTMRSHLTCQSQEEVAKQDPGSLETESSTSSTSISSGGAWQEVPTKVVKPRHPTLVGSDVTACLFFKNIPSQVNVLELVRHLEGVANCIVLRAGAKKLAFSSPFYFARVVLQTSDQAMKLLGLAESKKLEIAGRVLTAAFDRWPATDDTGNDPSSRYKRGEPYHAPPSGTNVCTIYIENLPNGTDIRHFVKIMQAKFPVTFQQAVLADGAKPYDNFWNAHAFMKTSSSTLELLRIGKKKNDKTSHLMYGGRYIWVKRDTNVPNWDALKQTNSDRLYCATDWAQAAKKQTEQ